jgi:excisionase family DNA binding protein
MGVEASRDLPTGCDEIGGEVFVFAPGEFEAAAFDDLVDERLDVIDAEQFEPGGQKCHATVLQCTESCGGYFCLKCVHDYPGNQRPRVRGGLAEHSYMQMLTSTHLLTVKETAIRLPLHEMTVRKLIREGRIPAVQLGGKGHSLRVPEAELNEWLYGKGAP